MRHGLTTIAEQLKLSRDSPVDSVGLSGSCRNGLRDEVDNAL